MESESFTSIYFAGSLPHKPLQHIFGKTRPVPHMASARLQRWALILGAYNYSICYKPGSSNNRECLYQGSTRHLPAEAILLLKQLQSSPITGTQIRKWTNQDPVLSRVRNYVLQDWQRSSNGQIEPYYLCKDELSIQNGCLLQGSRVPVSPAGRQAILELLHKSRPGVSRMRSLARSYLCWLNINKDIDSIIAKNLVMLLQLSLHLGSGFKAHGLVYISITLVQWKGIRRCYWLSLTLTLSGLMYIAEVTSTTSYIIIEKPRGCC